MNIDAILIVEDTPDTLAWLKGLCAEVFSDALVTTATTVADGKSVIAEQEFDLCLIDLGLPDGSGLELIEQLRELARSSYIVVATIYDDDKSLFTALQAGANGYILKDDERDSVISYLRGILSKEAPFSARTLNRIVQHFHEQGEEKRSISELTRRETEVLCLIAKGYSVGDTSEMLDISKHTVKGYVKDIYAKLGISSRAEATAIAIKLQLISA
ncbi:MAG: response regulator [Pseudomonadales bacterium]|jgi:DNA-binding NarL/FixJ family response regulator